MGLKFKINRTRDWIVLIVGVSILLGYFILRPKPVAVETGTATRGTFVEQIKVDGILRSKTKHIVSAFAEGDIKRVSLRVGDPVKKGQTVAELIWDMKFDSIKAPMTGVISKIFRESAGPIRRGDPILEIVDPNELEIMAELLTTDAVLVKVGDFVSAEGWGGGARIEGRVSRISKAGFTKPSALGVEEEKTEVTAELTKVPQEIRERLGSNFHVNVEIKTAEYSNVLRVPIGSIFHTGSYWSVYRVENGRAILTPIEISGRNNEEAMVAKGLKEGDLLINYPGDLIGEGTAVKPIK